jgi:flagellar basal-body rod modification protein FlgD
MSTVTAPSGNDVLAALTQRKEAAAPKDDIQDRFLTLLVTQLENQDPLNPMDNAQVTTQLAQISTVSGIDKLNASFGQLTAQLQAGQLLGAGALIGRNVLVPTERLTLTGGRAGGGVDLAASAERVLVQVLDSGGAVVEELDLGQQPAGQVAFELRSDLPDGAYRVVITATQGATAVTANLLGRGAVTRVIPDAKGIRVGVDGFGVFDLSAVKQLM